MLAVRRDLQLHVAESGSGPLMLFLHGFPEFWYAWKVQLKEFSNDHRAMAVDLRGYNLSDKPPSVEEYALPLLVEDIRQIITRESPGRPVVLVGHDWGGILAWTVAREFPALISQLVIINAPHPAVFARLLRENWGQRMASGYAGFFQLPWLPERMLTAFRCAALKRTVFTQCSRPAAFNAEDRAAYLHAWQQPQAIRAGINYYRANRALLGQIGEPKEWTILVPTLVLWGERDPFLRISNLKGLEDFVPNLTLRRNPRATHWIVHEEPAWIHDEIREALSCVRMNNREAFGT